MARHVTGEALLAACRAGRGTIVVVEGENDEDDAWFYNRWFGLYATEVTFIPQNGWTKVTEAVRLLRETYPHRHISGLIDRDQRTGERLVDGTWLTPRYTLENHLLEPASLVQALEPFERRARTLDETTEQLTLLFRRFATVAAYNLMMAGSRDRFVKHPEAVPKDLPTSVPSKAADFYAEAAGRLATADLDTLQVEVSGKYVLAALGTAFPALNRLDVHDRMGVLAQSPVPQDLRELVVKRILGT